MKLRIILNHNELSFEEINIEQCKDYNLKIEEETSKTLKMKQLNKRKEIEKYEEIEIKQKNKSNEIVEETMKGEEIKLKKENFF